ncbi:hypothetical protein EZS27_028414 [termite gut metagenome]|uniref:Uncharacterized protein n=1 Tax=termite gut metagenome TaxID=433724 RepID=A0A5J4QM42_9ZZZZ
MKKNISIVFVALCSVLLIISCYDDKSILPDKNSFNDVVIDTAGIGSSIRIGFLEEFKLVPKITFGSRLESDFEFEWSINTNTANMRDIIVLSQDKVFDGFIPNAISPRAYKLMYKLKDTKYGLEYLTTWDVTVVSSFLDGILVSETFDGITSDFSLIMDKDLTYLWNKDERIVHTILESGYDESYQGLMNNLHFSIYSSQRNQVWAQTPQGDLVCFNTEAFQVLGKNENVLMLYRPSNFKPGKMYNAQQNTFLNSNVGLFQINYDTGISFNVATQGFDPDNDVMAWTSYQGDDPSLVWYNKVSGKIYKFTNTFVTPIYSNFDPVETGASFDPNNLQGKTAIAGGKTFDNQTLALLLKDDAANSYSIYTFSNYYMDYDTWESTPAAPKAKIDIPSSANSLFEGAVDVFFARNEPVLYIAKPNGVYAIPFGTGTGIPDLTPKYTPPAGEVITMAKLYMQGKYMAKEQLYSDGIPQMPLNSKAIMLATSKGEYESKIYVIPMTQIGTGNLDGSKALTYDGFGKILGVITVGY